MASGLATDLALIRQRDRTLEIVNEILEPARTEVVNLLTTLVDQETAERGYIITGDEEFLEPYYAARVQGDRALDELERLVDGEPELTEAVSRVRAAVTLWRQLGADFEVATKRAGRHVEATILVGSGTGKDLFDRARRELAELRARIVSRLAEEQGELNRLRSLITSVHTVSLGLALVLLGAGALLLRRWITRPLEEMTAAVRAVAAGDLGRAIPAAGPPDLAALGADVEAMRRRILAEADTASRAESALGKHGTVILTLREELAPSVPSVPTGLRVAVRFNPAEGVVAGDWYDWVRLGDDRLTLALADVSGHGDEAGVLALRTKTLTLAALRDGLSPGDAFGWVADQLGDTGEQFVTAVIVELEGRSGRLRYANAGHPPLLLGNGGRLTALPPTGPLLGPLPGSWSTMEAELGCGLIVAYSDGMVEARDPTRRAGTDQLLDFLLSHSHDDLEALADGCLETMGLSLPGRADDDSTLVLVARDPGYLQSRDRGLSSSFASSSATSE